MPLSEKKFLARRAELDADEEEEKIAEEHNNGTTEVIKRTYYENEVIAITLDYLRLLGKDKVADASKTAVRPN